jgi:hypothetical protein
MILKIKRLKQSVIIRKIQIFIFRSFSIRLNPQVTEEVKEMRNIVSKRFITFKWTASL